jgi:2,4-didehydro-3-deoxy-L-rhamnonate hydrolase
MNSTPFKLGTFAKQGGGAFAAILLDDDDIINLKRAPNAAALSSTDSIDGLLEDWDANFAALQKISDALQKEGRRGAVKLASLRPSPPVRRPGKMFYAAQNFQDHVDEMLRAA